MYYFEEWQFPLCLSILSALNSCYCFLNQPSTFCTVLILDSSLTSHLLSCPRSFSQTRVQEGLQVWVTSSVRIVVCFNKRCWSFLISLHGDKILIFLHFSEQIRFKLWNATCHFGPQTIYFRKFYFVFS